ncbi:MAG: radical SAM protein, partial [Nitrospirae bacterium]
MGIPVKTNYFLSPNHILRLLEEPSLYDVKDDELYELDERAFEFLKTCYLGGCPDTDDMEFIEYCLSEEILTSEKTVPLKHTIRVAPEPSLRYLELLITDRCNLRCRHCYVGEPEARELPFEEIVRVLEEFEEMQGLRVLISGGEPLLYKEFENLNEFLKDYPLRKVLLTNGLLLSTDRLKSLNVEEIQISLDGMKRGHESLRGRGTFERTLEA